jgi:FkbM family methyltransferase
MNSILFRMKRRIIGYTVIAKREGFVRSTHLQFHLFGRARFIDKFGLRYYLFPGYDLSLIHTRRTLFDDPNLYSLMEKFIAPSAIVVDVGANVGLFTLFAARCAASGHIYAFEPEKTNIEHLRQNLKFARCENATIEPYALSNYTGTAVLNVFSTNRVLNSFGRPIIQTSEKVYESDATQEVPVTTLDSFAETHNLSHIDLLKIDVEGAEPRVLAGCEQLLRHRKIKHIIFEISQTPLHALGYTAYDTFDILEKHGYIINRILPGGITLQYDPKEDSKVTLANFLAVLLNNESELQ